MGVATCQNWDPAGQSEKLCKTTNYQIPPHNTRTKGHRWQSGTTSNRQKFQILVQTEDALY